MPLPSQHPLLPDSENPGSSVRPRIPRPVARIQTGIVTDLEPPAVEKLPWSTTVRSLTSPGGSLERPFDRAEATLAACNPVEDPARGVDVDLKPE
ncbi:hypothetical protein OUZ56_026169 [Daphnia magna]|uniref:Uncharacterized protein n=1 Tax=Daphnia magna TaxID=35525 RepID=A0ABQ9ZLS8_9CRUS|nr:hypothetical protein OUZ56_026169 [Daphnia magna]